MESDRATAFRRLMDCVERGLDFSAAYGEREAVADYLVLRPEEDPTEVRATLTARLCAMHRVWSERITNSRWTQ